MYLSKFVSDSVERGGKNFFKKIVVNWICFVFSLQVSLLIHMNDEFSAEDFCTVIFDEFFFAGLARDNVPKHLLKLLWYIYPKLPTARLQTLVKALQPTSQVKVKEAWANVPCLT